MTELKINLAERSYKITVGKDILKSAKEFMNLNRKVFIITDAEVPKEYAEVIVNQAKEGIVYTVAAGEGSKSIKTLEAVLEKMLDFGLSRSDCVVAVGGGVVGDLSGFAASVYMRGIDFYNVPTTLLAQLDSSIGGKCAVNLGGVKNTVGSFYQPKHVLVDTETLRTLPQRHFAAGLAEAVKMSLTSDGELFRIFESEEINCDSIEKIIVPALMIKKSVVEKDERESGLRKILNFGHTFGHGIESAEGMSGLYHGECVALGMIPVSSDEVRARLIPVLKKLGLPTEYSKDVDAALGYVLHDKKSHADRVEAVFVDVPGSFRIENMKISDFSKLVKERLERL